MPRLQWHKCSKKGPRLESLFDEEISKWIRNGCRFSDSLKKPARQIFAYCLTRFMPCHQTCKRRNPEATSYQRRLRRRGSSRCGTAKVCNIANVRLNSHDTESAILEHKRIDKVETQAVITHNARWRAPEVKRRNPEQHELHGEENKGTQEKG